MSTKQRARNGYLNYNSMLNAISTGKLDAYDVNYTPDTMECYIVAPDLKPWAIKSKVFTFNTVEEALNTLNSMPGTYVGQIVSILKDDKYVGYIVNYLSDGYTVTPLNEYTEEIDYNTLGDRPIINLVGSLDEPIMVCELSCGIYKIKGQYKISNFEETIYLSASNVIFTVTNEEGSIKVKKITSDEIVDYLITESDMTKNVYITDKYLKDNNYATVPYVDSKIEVLSLSLKDEMQLYVKGLVEDSFTQELDKKIDNRITEVIQPTTDDLITGLF